MTILILRGRSGYGQSLYTKFVSNTYHQLVSVWDANFKSKSLINSSIFDWYLSPLSQIWKEIPISQVRIEFLNNYNNIVAYLYFDGSKSQAIADWMGIDNLINAFPWDYPTIKAIGRNWNMFSISGRDNKRFWINYRSSGCKNDIGLIAVIEGTSCAWTGTGSIPRFYYAVHPTTKSVAKYATYQKSAKYIQVSIVVQSAYTTYVNDDRVFG